MLQVQETIAKILNEDKNRQTIFENNIPGRTWMTLFLKRHPELSKRNTELISKSRASVTEKAIREWFAEVKHYLTSENCFDIMDDPSRIFNCDETGMQTCPKSGKVLGPKQLKNFYGIAGGNEKECITVLCNYAADGKIVPPMIVYPYKRIPRDVASSVPDGFGIGRSDSGWMVSATFYEYVANLFYPWLVENKIKFPIIFFLDGHKSHINLELYNFCNEKRILLYCLLPNATHILQPCDVAIFRPLKVEWRKTVSMYKQKTSKILSKHNFAPLLKEAFDASMKSDTIKNGFRVCGLYPFDASAVDYQKCISTRRNSMQKQNNREVDNTINVYKYEIAKEILALEIGANKVQLFESGNHIPMEDKSLYNIYKSILNKLQDVADKERANEMNVIPENIIQLELNNDADLDFDEVPGNKSLENEAESSEFNIMDLPIDFEEDEFYQDLFQDPSKPNVCDFNLLQMAEMSRQATNHIFEEAPQVVNIISMDIFQPKSKNTDQAESSKNVDQPELTKNKEEPETSYNEEQPEIPNTEETHHKTIEQPQTETSSTEEQPKNEKQPETSYKETQPETPSTEETHYQTKEQPQSSKIEGLLVVNQIETYKTIYQSDITKNEVQPETSYNQKQPEIQNTEEAHHQTKEQPDTSKIKLHASKTEKNLFDQHLHWPTIPKTKGNKRTPAPYAIVSQKWKEYYLNAEKQKSDIENEKLRKKTLRDTKKQEREEKKQKKNKNSNKENIPTDTEDDLELDNLELDNLELDDVESNKITDIDILYKPKNVNEIDIDNWALVEYSTKKTIKYYIGQVIEKDGEECVIKFLRKANNKFVWPQEDDIDLVLVSNIFKVLNAPVLTRRGGDFF